MAMIQALVSLTDLERSELNTACSNCRVKAVCTYLRCTGDENHLHIFAYCSSECFSQHGRSQTGELKLTKPRRTSF